MTTLFHWIHDNAYVILFDSVLFVLLILYLCHTTITYRKRNRQQHPIAEAKKVTSISSSDIKAIAGDDVCATQLDLARAYIEMGKQKIAKQILDHVIKNGNEIQQQLAERLLVQNKY